MWFLNIIIEYLNWNLVDLRWLQLKRMNKHKYKDRCGRDQTSSKHSQFLNGALLFVLLYNGGGCRFWLRKGLQIYFHHLLLGAQDSTASTVDAKFDWDHTYQMNYCIISLRIVLFDVEIRTNQYTSQKCSCFVFGFFAPEQNTVLWNNSNSSLLINGN